MPVVTKTNAAHLIVFMENGGQVAGLHLPAWASRLLDWSTEEYAKLAITWQARRHYQHILFLEDERATAGELWQALLDAGDSIIDLLLLVHGQEGYACGFQSQPLGADFFAGLRAVQAAGLAHFRLRAVYQMNCYGQSLAGEWLSLGAEAVNGAVGINWLPEPSLSLFLARWLAGQPFSQAVKGSNQAASRLLSLVWRPRRDAAGRRRPHPKIASSRMLVFGDSKLA